MQRPHAPVVISCLIFATIISVSSLSSAQNDPSNNQLKVFVLVGQSNMQGHAHVRTLPHLSMDPTTKPLLDAIFDENQKARVHKDIWISYLSSAGEKSGNLTTGFGADENKIGPELMFGIQMQKRIGEPILIIKTAWGGKSINTDFRPPSAGPYEFNSTQLERFKQQEKDLEAIKEDKVLATGVYYKQTIEHVRKVLADIKTVYPDYDAESGYELAGLVWFQGWNDMVDSSTYPKRGEAGGYAEYSQVLEHLFRDFRKDLKAPQLPIVVGVMGVQGPTKDYPDSQKRYLKIHQGFRDAMAAPAKKDEFKDNVFNVLTEECWDLELDRILERDSIIKNRVKNSKKDAKLFELGQEVLNLEHDASKDDALRKLEERGELEKEILKSLRLREFNEREAKILDVGKSNFAFHYLGSAKIMARIGKAFADAIPIESK